MKTLTSSIAARLWHPRKTQKTQKSPCLGPLVQGCGCRPVGGPKQDVDLLWLGPLVPASQGCATQGCGCRPVGGPTQDVDSPHPAQGRRTATQLQRDLAAQRSEGATRPQRDLAAQRSGAATRPQRAGTNGPGTSAASLSRGFRFAFPFTIHHSRITAADPRGCGCRPVGGPTQDVDSLWLGPLVPASQDVDSPHAAQGRRTATQLQRDLAAPRSEAATHPQRANSSCARESAALFPFTNHPSRITAFSLVEVLAAVALIGIIVFLAIPNIVRVKEDSEANLAIARAEAVNLSMASYVQAQGGDAATTAWDAADEDGRYDLVASYLAFAPAALGDYMPDDYAIDLAGHEPLRPLWKVVLTGPGGAISY